MIGSHRQGELPGMHLGSVASYCVHHAPCPVVVVRGLHTGR
ncbi:MAG: universal stress protein [Pseudonocardiaceae bacterium]